MWGGGGGGSGFTPPFYPLLRCHINYIFYDWQVCMFLSAGYHMFYCQSEFSSRRWLRLDLFGVSVGLCGCYFPGAYYAFHCHKVTYVSIDSVTW